MTDLERAVAALLEKSRLYTTLWDYYDGDHPLVYSAKRLEILFKKLDAKFTQNWCGVIVDSVLDRLSLASIEVAENKEATERLSSILRETELLLDDETVHQAALVCSEAFVIAWRDEEGIEAYYNDPRLCHAFYDPDHPRQMQCVAKWWKAADEKMRLTLYYPDRLEYYVSRGKADTVHRGRDFEAADPPRADNPYGVIPVVHFRKERRGYISELGPSIRSQQDAVNKTMADMMVNNEFNALRERWIISSSETDAALKSAPNEILVIPAAGEGEQNTEVGQFDETPPTGFLEVMEKLASGMAVTSRTPKHYFWAQGGDPSGEALMAMEAPLVKKCLRYIERFEAGWARLGWLLLRLDGMDVPALSVTATFDAPETVQPKTHADIRKLSVQAGMPLRTGLRREGWTDEELAEMDADSAADQELAASSLAAAMMRQQRAFDQGEDEG